MRHLTFDVQAFASVSKTRVQRSIRVGDLRVLYLTI